MNTSPLSSISCSLALHMVLHSFVLTFSPTYFHLNITKSTYHHTSQCTHLSHIYVWIVCRIECVDCILNSHLSRASQKRMFVRTYIRNAIWRNCIAPFHIYDVRIRRNCNAYMNNWWPLKRRNAVTLGRGRCPSDVCICILYFWIKDNTCDRRISSILLNNKSII